MPSVIQTQDDFDDMSWGDKKDWVVSDEYVDSSRWYEIWYRVWQERDTYYAYTYRVPATEMQEIDDDFDPQEINEVEPYEVTVTKYRRIK